MNFHYRSGDTPLDGFTIKRGVGKGGFGEVYFAVSDGGKEVALKLLGAHPDVELRGVAHCLNLKHPNLVHVYDLKTDRRGDKWVVMEYVLGESLAQVLDRHPHGLPGHLAREWFGCLARAVGFLHDHGVVHRDLKPGNIFIENGTLKVGDYGLCRSLSSGGGRPTQKVGTVHYMAPEISTGNYNKQIDIYACGVILHEMLTGQVPFNGETDGEILMKHLTAAPDVGRLPAGFQPVVLKALDKNPLKRHGGMAEFARAVEAVPLPVAAPAQVPVMAEVVQREQPLTLPAVAKPASPIFVEVRPEDARKLPQARPASMVARERVADVSGALVKAPLVAAVGLLPYALVTQTWDATELGRAFLLAAGLSWGMLLAANGTAFRAADGWGRRLAGGLLGAVVGGVAWWLDGWTLPVSEATSVSWAGLPSHLMDAAPDAVSAGLKYALYFGTFLAAGRWWRAAARDRAERWSLFPLLAAGFWATALSFLLPWTGGHGLETGLVPAVLAAAAVQAASPWTPPPPAPPKKRKLA